MGGNSNQKKASGDAKPAPADPENKEASEAELPKLPDVMLVVDGFGFMPKERPARERRRSSVFAKSKLGPQQDTTDEHNGENTPCASSTNIEIVRRYTWRTKNRMKVQVITYGATITAISVPDKRGVPDDVIAGFDTLEEYFQPTNPYFGGTIGRYANVIRDASFLVRPSGRMYMVSTNKGQHHYNGGYVGFDKVNWHSYVSGLKVVMSHVSQRFHEGYPGTVMCQVTFEVTCDNTIKIEMKCTTSEPTIINLTNTPFFNLAGHHSGSDLMLDHIFTINADKYTDIDEEGFVTGEKKVVGGTPYDFRVPRTLRTMLPKIPMGGYDINYCITRATDQGMTFQARVLHPLTGRVLEIYSNQPGLQFYTGNLLPDPDKIFEIPKEENNKFDEEGEEESSEQSSTQGEETEVEEREGVKPTGYIPLVGKKGTLYKRHGLFCLIPQNYPDAINNRNFPNSVLNPGEEYVHKMQYKFGILLGRYV